MKVLIFDYENSLKPIGGPKGYLFNIKQQRDLVDDKRICFISQDNVRKNCVRKIIDYIFYKIIDKIYKENSVRKILRTLYQSRVRGEIDFSQYDVIHFHNTFQLYSQRKSLLSYKGIVILTSHSPKAAWKELIEDYSSEEEYAKYKKLFDKTEEFDRFAFERADVLLFPCAGAEEPLYHTWEPYHEIRKEKAVKYLLTGTVREIIKTPRDQIREKLKIPADAFVISFVGRHNCVKGYDRLIELFESLDNIYVICCGSRGSIEPPVSDRWIEVGWTNEPYSFVNASDVFFVGNRETYFDLSVIQTLSVGQIMLLSNTGGNKYFEGMREDGIFLWDSIEDAIGILKKIRVLDEDERKLMMVNQKKLFESTFDVSVFYSNYIQFIKNVVNDR